MSEEQDQNQPPTDDTAAGVLRRRRGDEPGPVESEKDAAKAAETTSPETPPPVQPPAAAPEESASSPALPEVPAAAPTSAPEPAPGEPAEATPRAAGAADASADQQARPKKKPRRRKSGARSKSAAPDVDFGDLLSETELDRGIEQGMMASGPIIAASGDWVFVDLGAKTEGILAAEELLDENGEPKFGVGDTVEAFVVSTRGGEIRLSFALGRQIRDFDALEDAYENRIPVEGRVEGTNKGGFDVMVGGRRAFCPISQIDVAYTEDPSIHVGKTYQFRIIELSRKGKRLVVSRAALLREKLEEQREALRDELFEGAILEGIVTSIQEYGAFVDLGGLEGLVHVSELTWGRVEHPSEVLQPGDSVTVKVLDVRQTEKGERISLSIRQTSPHPWVAVGTKFVEGETYRGTVTRLEPYGAFVELGPGIEGLAHVSELSWERRVNHPSELLDVGQPIDVYVKSIDHERQRIALSVKALQKDPWDDAGDRYPAGSQIKGTVERIQPFGLFVEVEPGLVALVPASESGTGQGADLRREFQPGAQITATVLSVDPDRRRMSLSLKAFADSRDEQEVKKFLKTQRESEQKSGGFGTLGDLFGDKLK